MNIAGVLNILKPKSVTSFQVVHTVRKVLGVDKVGHLGTLDPLAIGVLPICVGYATRFADYLSDVHKSYIADIIFGYETDSYDITGEVVNRSENIIPTEDEVISKLSKFKGVITLTVPAFSAKKIDGVRAYKLAREKKIGNAGSFEMKIDNIELLKYNYPDGRIRVDCSKGTYIRSIVDTLGKELGVFATMSNLVRTKNGSFNIDNAIKLEKFKSLSIDEMVDYITPVTELLNWGRAVVSDSRSLSRLKDGVSLNIDEYQSVESRGNLYFITDIYNNLLAIGERCDIRTPIKVKAVFMR